MVLYGSDCGKIIVYTVRLTCHHTLYTNDKKRLFCKEIDFFVTQQDNGVVREGGQGVWPELVSILGGGWEPHFSAECSLVLGPM